MMLFTKPIIRLYENPPIPPLPKGGKGGFSCFVVPAPVMGVIVVNGGGRLDSIAEFNPEYLSQKTGAGYWCHLQVKGVRFSIDVSITAYHQVPSSLKPFSLNNLRQASATALS